MLKKFITTINRSIFVGERFERNIQNLLTESYIFIVLGVVIALLNFAKGEYRIVILSLLFVVAGFVDVYYLKMKLFREFSFVLTCTFVPGTAMLYLPCNTSHCFDSCRW